jgi:hypothetical protein
MLLLVSDLFLGDMENYFKSLLLALLSLWVLTSCNKKSSEKVYICTCHYHDLATNKDTVISKTYPAGTDQATAQSECDSMQIPVNVIDPTAKCSL